MRLPVPGQRARAAVTAGGGEILLYRFGSGRVPVLFLGGVHGDETEGFLFAERLLDGLQRGDYSPDPRITLWVSPRVNPDGCRAERRTNHHNVDLNRNMPTRDWTGEFQNVRYYPGPSGGSEIETRFVMDLIESAIEPTGNGLVISLHSYEHAMINYNGDCLDLAQEMSRHNGLEPKGDIGYPTPGSLGTYGGWERNIPVITLEIHRGDEPETVWKQHLGAVLRAIDYYADHPIPSRKAAPLPAGPN